MVKQQHNRMTNVSNTNAACIDLRTGFVWQRLYMSPDVWVLGPAQVSTLRTALSWYFSWMSTDGKGAHLVLALYLAVLEENKMHYNKNVKFE